MYFFPQKKFFFFFNFYNFFIKIKLFLSLLKKIKSHLILKKIKFKNLKKKNILNFIYNILSFLKKNK
jgi:hypothetical protein